MAPDAPLRQSLSPDGFRLVVFVQNGKLLPAEEERGWSRPSAQERKNLSGTAHSAA